MERCFWEKGAVVCAVPVRSLNPFWDDPSKRKRLRRFFSRREMNFAAKKFFPCERLAARLAAKRALLYLLRRCGYCFSLAFDRMEVLNQASGLPWIRTSDRRLGNYLTSRKVRLGVSLTHTHETAFAFVVIEKQNREKTVS